MKFGFDDTRWVIEPRARGECSGYSAHCWLVVKDKLTGKYLTAKGRRAYARFSNSDEVAEYLNGLKEVEEDVK